MGNGVIDNHGIVYEIFTYSSGPPAGSQSLTGSAGAFTVNNLAVNIAENGTAGISGDYSLSWIERAVVFT